VILIDNIKRIRNLNYFLKVNKNLLNYNYIFFCYNVDIKALNSTLIKNKQIKYYFLKKLKCIKYLNFAKIYLNNSIVFFCMNDVDSVNFFLHTIKNNILYCKIINSFYSLNNFDTYINSNITLINYLNNNVFTVVNYIQYLENKLKN